MHRIEVSKSAERNWMDDKSGRNRETKKEKKKKRAKELDYKSFTQAQLFHTLAN